MVVRSNRSDVGLDATAAALVRWWSTAAYANQRGRQLHERAHCSRKYRRLMLGYLQTKDWVEEGQ